MSQEINSLYYRLRMFPSKIVQKLRFWKYRMMGYDIHPTVRLERGLNLDRINAKGIHIGRDTEITSRVTILSHRLIPHIYTDKHGNERTKSTGIVCDTYIGHSCLIGTGATIMPGVKIGNYCIVGAGAVVTKNVPDKTIVAGNPARVIKEGIEFDGIRI